MAPLFRAGSSAATGAAPSGSQTSGVVRGRSRQWGSAMAGGTPAPGSRYPQPPKVEGEEGAASWRAEPGWGLSIPRDVIGSVQGENRLPLPLGAFVGEEGGIRQNEEYRSGAFLSHPETWLEISLFPQPSPLVLLPHAKLGVKATPQVSPISETGSQGTQTLQAAKSRPDHRLASGRTHSSGSQIHRRYRHPRSLPAARRPASPALPKIRAPELWRREDPAPSAQPAAARALLDTQTPLPGAEIFRKEGQCRHFSLNSQEFPPERCKRRAEKKSLPCSA